MKQDYRDCLEISDLLQENQRLRLLQRIAQLVSEHHARPTLLQPVLRELQHFFSVDGGGIYQIDTIESPRCLTAYLGIPNELVRELHKIPVGKGLTEQVLRREVPGDWTDLRCEPQLYCQAVLDNGWRSMLCLPLIAEEKPIGALFLFQRISRQFSKLEIELLEQVCRILAGAILTMELLKSLEWQQQINAAGRRELERSRTQLRAHLMRLEESNRALEHANRSKTRFLGLASHELRTPLTCILSGAELLQLKLHDAPEEISDLIGTVEQGALRLQNLIEDLLEVARVESRDLYLAKEPLDHARILKELHLEYTIKAAGHEVTLSLADLPEGFSLLGDAHHLQRALARLLDNAIRHTPEKGRIHIATQLCSDTELGGEKPLLEKFCPDFFSSSLAKHYLKLQIRDNGPGIAEEERLRIFESFHGTTTLRHHGRHPKTGKTSGAGLGLPLAKGIVEGHCGMIWVDSAPDDEPGSAFNILLPLLTAHRKIGQSP